MSGYEFVKYLDRKAAQFKVFSEDIDASPEEYRDNYIDWVHKVMTCIEAWVLSVQDDHFTFKYEDEYKEFFDGLVGEYRVPVAYVTMYDIRIKIEPTGCNIFGARGAIDIKESRGIQKRSIRVVYKHSEDEETEFAFINRRFEYEYIEFTDKNFFKILLEIGEYVDGYEEPYHDDPY